MFRSIWIAAGAAVLLAVGALTAVAANSHGKAVSTLATTTTLNGEAKGDAISAMASAKGEAKSDAALDPPTLAAWTMLTNELMNLDEVLNK